MNNATLDVRVDGLYDPAKSEEENLEAISGFYVKLLKRIQTKAEAEGVNTGAGAPPQTTGAGAPSGGAKTATSGQVKFLHVLFSKLATATGDDKWKGEKAKAAYVSEKYGATFQNLSDLEGKADMNKLRRIIDHLKKEVESHGEPDLEPF